MFRKRSPSDWTYDKGLTNIIGVGNTTGGYAGMPTSTEVPYITNTYSLTSALSSK